MKIDQDIYEGLNVRAWGRRWRIFVPDMISFGCNLR